MTTNYREDLQKLRTVIDLYDTFWPVLLKDLITRITRYRAANANECPFKASDLVGLDRFSFRHVFIKDIHDIIMEEVSGEKQERPRDEQHASHSEHDEFIVLNTFQMLISILNSRQNIVSKIAVIKREQRLKTLDNDRWRKILTQKKQEAANHGLSPAFVETFFTRLHDESLHYQELLGKASLN